MSAVWNRWLRTERSLLVILDGGQDLYGHTDPETTMIYAPPQLRKHAAAIERLQRADRVPAPVPAVIRLAELAGSSESLCVNR